jgi:SNF2 family DNA or RNA helicase
LSPEPSRELFDYQQAAADLMVDRKQCAAFLAVGLGKTAIALHALTALGCRRTLVLAPAKVVETNVWGQEVEKWRMSLAVVGLCGTAKQRQSWMDSGVADIECLSYELIPWLLSVCNLAERYDAIVFDELSKMKTPGTVRFRRLRKTVTQIPVRFGLTGSPVPNNYLDLWGEMFMVAGEKPLGPTYGNYLSTYFMNVSNSPKFRIYKVQSPRHVKAIQQKVKPFAFSLDEKHRAKLIPPVKTNILELDLPLEVDDMIEELTSQAVVEIQNGARLEALSKSALGIKLQQLSSGAVYTTNGDVLAEKTWSEVHAVKLDALADLLEEQQGDPVLCFYWFRHELERIQIRFPQAVTEINASTLARWDRKEIPLLLVHPQSAGHGLNLQHGSHTVVWFSRPWSHELWEQGNGRLARMGQQSPVVVANVLSAGAMDRRVTEALAWKGEAQRGVLEATKIEVR